MNTQAIETIKARIDNRLEQLNKVLDKYAASGYQRTNHFERRIQAIEAEIDGLEFALEALGVHGYVDRDYEC